MRRHAHMRGSPGEPVDHPQEPLTEVDLGRIRIGPLPLHHPHAQSELDGRIRIAQAPAPAAGQSTPEARMQRDRPRDPFEGRGCVPVPQGIKVHPHAPQAGPLEDLRQQSAVEFERRRFHRQVTVQRLAGEGVQGGEMRVGYLAGAVGIPVPKADGASHPLVGQPTAGPQCIRQGRPGQIAFRGPRREGQPAGPQHSPQPAAHRPVPISSRRRRHAWRTRSNPSGASARHNTGQAHTETHRCTSRVQILVQGSSIPRNS